MDLVAPIAVLLVAAAVTLGTEASIHAYDLEPFREVGNALLLSGGSEGIVASRLDALGPLRIGDGRAYIKFENITFSRSKESAQQHSKMEHSTGLVQAIIFDAADRDNIGGSAYGGQRSICCTPDLAKLEGCKQGEVIRRPSSVDPEWPVILSTHFNADYISTKLDPNQVNITKTGMYNLFFISCDPKLRGLTMSGKTIWKNPDGYLPGRMSSLMNFYMFMSLAYLVLSFIWFSQYVRFWRDILPLQNCILSVIALGLFEMTLWYFEYLNFNVTGIRPVGITTWVVTVGAVRKTVSRLLILIVSMGYGVVRPTLGGLTSKVLLLGVTYFLASELLSITENVGAINDISGKARLFLVLPNAFLDAFLILWIFTSLSRTLEKLQARRSTVKLDIYRKFTNALAVTVIASVAWIGYEVYFKATDPFSERWQSAWIITAFWDVQSLLLLCIMCYLWAPSQSSQRYTYSGEAGEDDEEAQVLTKGTLDANIGLVRIDRKERGVDDGDTFTLEDNVEEDKQS
ncbi:transmembrane protein 87B-like isoform X1 [Zingiber officinale]|uniref:transmembrane protein 87B-like isoform X1 n=1 Tax=Zingiber officinale TaxID=94328 RepID=UPI001C4C2481|nr:transmembrane protein 87B-like isoform X1 [Zingiber officinale]